MSGCIQCGSCCIKYGMRLEASPLDIARWTFENRDDILRHVLIQYEGGEVSGGQLWVDEAGKRLQSCPFLKCENEKYYCGIHESEPEVCSGHYCQKYVKLD